MSATEIVACVILLLLAAAALVLSVRHFMQRGFLLNNAYLYASKEERARMDKRPHYRQSGVVLALCGLCLLICAGEVAFRATWLFYAQGLVLTAALVYAIVSEMHIARQGRAKDQE